MAIIKQKQKNLIKNQLNEKNEKNGSSVKM